jgi:short subunit dehydrogenase-like uncharacterized protein
VTLDDEPGLRDLLVDASVVINCAGPFTLAGDAVARAAIDTGTHYIDSTGEQPFIAMMFDRHGAAAERAAVALLPALGFDYLPGDLIASIAAEEREPLRELVVAYAVNGFGMTRGTMRSTLEIMKGGDLIYEDGGWRPSPTGVFRAHFAFPDPIGRQAVTRYPSGEVITVPRHTQTRRVVSLLATSTAAPHPLAAAILPYAQPVLALALNTPLRSVLHRAIGSLPEGPSEAQRRAVEWTIVADARGEDGSRGRAVVRGTDVYGITATILAHAAELLSDPGFDRAGALGPAAAFEPRAFLDHLGEHGVSWERSESLPLEHVL